MKMKLKSEHMYIISDMITNQIFFEIKNKNKSQII